MTGPARSRRQRVHPEGVPLVADLARASRLLAVPEDRLAVALSAAQVDVWGYDSWGRAVYSWGRLLELARGLGVQPPAALDPERRRATSLLAVNQDRGWANRRKASS